MADTDVLSAQQADFLFRIGEAERDVLLVTGFTGTEGISELYHFRLDLVSDDAEIDLTAQVGKPGTLEIRGAAGSRYVHGIVRRFERAGEGINKTNYAAEIVPAQWLLTRRTKSRIFQEHNCADMTVPGIVKKVLQDAGIPEDNYRFALEASYATREYVVQYRESEMDFISRLMEEEGIFYFFEHTADGYAMVIGDSQVAHVPLPTDPEIPFRDPSGLVPDKEFVFSLRESHQIQHGAVCLDDFNFEQPTMALRSSVAGPDYTGLEFSDCPGEYVEKGVGDRLAQVRLEENAATRQVVQMAAVARGLIPGFKFTLIGHPNPAINREYLVTHISHRASQTQSAQEEVDGAQVGTRHDLDVRGIPSDIAYRPPRVTPKPTVLGSQTARVTGPQGEEIYTDKYGRVKVKFHWDREGRHDENASCWIRVSQGWAGGAYGMMFLPRVGQEVVVDFLEGNPDNPLITGRVYNGDHMPPYALPDEKTKSTIKTNSSKGGGGTNEIRFEDLKGSEQLFLQAQRQMDTRVKASHFHTVGGSYHLHVGGEKDGELKGEYLQLVYENKHVHVKGNLNTAVDMDESREITQKRSTKVDGTDSTQVGGDVVFKFGANHKHEVTQTYALKALSIKLEADTGIELKCGGSSICITPAAIFITGGPLVNINSGSGPPVGPVMAQATSPEAPDDAAVADLSQPGKDVSYNTQPDDYQPTDVPPTPGPPPEPGGGDTEVKTWVEIELVNEFDEPVPSEPCVIRTPDGKELRRTTDANGLIRVTGVSPGECEVCFPEIDAEAWERA
jgi:type VI secretion system secreted protein VgrG